MIFWRDWARRGTRWLLEAPARAFAALGVSPATLTICSLLVCLGSGLYFALGNYTAAAWMYLASGFFDMTDGRVARLTGKASDAGAYLDSFTDRYGDGAVIAGITYHLAKQGEDWYLVAALVALIASFVVSYSKARAENFIDECKVGFWERPERMLLLVLAGFLGYEFIRYAVVILAVGSLLTSLRRASYTMKRLKQKEDSSKPGNRTGESFSNDH